MPTPTAVQTFLKPEAVLREAGIRAGWKVADFGCGPGYYVVPAARFVGTTGRVVGVDLRSVAVEEAKKRVRSAGLEDRTDIVRADLTKPAGSGIPAEWADLVLLVGTLYQSEPQSVLREAARVVTPSGGRVLVVEWDEVATPVGPPPEQRLPQDRVLAAAKAAGLHLLSAFAPSPHQYGLIFAKPEGTP